jgi:hypothetical protein
MIKRTRPYRTQRIAHQGKSKLITTIDDKPIWDLLKEYINSMPMSYTLSRIDIIRSIYNINHVYVSLRTLDNYLYELRAVNVLKRVKSGKYQKLRDIPIKLTTSQLMKISNKSSWESWFMTIDYI